MTTKKIAIVPSSPVSSRQRALDLVAALDAAVLERSTEARLLVACAIAGHHALLLGEPGTGKSYLAEALASAVDADCFRYLMGKATTPDEVIGAPDLKRWSDTGERVLRTKHKLTSASIGFLDEVFKSNSVVLNALLRLINERTFIDDAGEHASPLRFVVAASNETPEPGEVDAFYDRFLVALCVEPVADPVNRRALARRQLPPRPSKVATLADLDAARAEARALPISDAAIDALDAVVSALRSKGVIVSDRRFQATIDLMQVVAWLDGHAEVGAASVDVARHTTWRRLDQRATVDAAVEAAMPKIDADLAKIAKVLVEQDAAIRASSTLSTKARRQEALGAVADVLDDLTSDLDRLERENPNAKPAIDIVRSRVKATNEACNAATIAAFRTK